MLGWSYSWLLLCCRWQLILNLLLNHCYWRPRFYWRINCHHNNGVLSNLAIDTGICAILRSFYRLYTYARTHYMFACMEWLAASTQIERRNRVVDRAWINDVARRTTSDVVILGPRPLRCININYVSSTGGTCCCLAQDASRQIVSLQLLAIFSILSPHV